VASIGDNGGPPLADDENDPPKLRWVKVNIAEALEGMEDLTMEERGFCWTGWLKMYARMGGLPADEHVGARIMGCDIRLYRRLCRALVGEGAKFYVEDGLIKNSRVEREIAAFCREHKKRRDAALEREAKRRLQMRSGELPGDFSQTSRGLLPQVSNMFTAQEAKITETSSQKPNEINVCTATTVAQQNQSPALTRTTNQNHQPEREESKPAIDQPPALAGLNGSAEPMLRDVIAWMGGGDERSAREWLSKMIHINGQDAVKQGYLKLSTDMVSGVTVARPLEVWAKIATRLRQDVRRGVADAEAKPSKRDERLAYASQVAEQVASEKSRRRP
jgi:hypothetical protein